MNTTEVVSQYHPDKIADRIADYLAEWWRPDVRSAIEVVIKNSHVFVAGESSIADTISREKILRAIRAVYGDRIHNYYPSIQDIETTIEVSDQSPDIITTRQDGAGDNGVMYGYHQTNPSSHYILHDLMKTMLRDLPQLLGDAKLLYTDDVLTLNAHLVDDDTDVVLDYLQVWAAGDFIGRTLGIRALQVNPNGPFTIGGPLADAGVTGRKIINDAHGTGVPHGGGAFHGKDLTKVDRSGAYLAQELANRIGRRLERDVLVELSYIIGDAEPVMRVHDDTGNYIIMEIPAERVPPLADWLKFLYANTMHAPRDVIGSHHYGQAWTSTLPVFPRAVAK